MYSCVVHNNIIMVAPLRSDSKSLTSYIIMHKFLFFDISKGSCANVILFAAIVHASMIKGPCLLHCCRPWSRSAAKSSRVRVRGLVYYVAMRP